MARGYTVKEQIAMARKRKSTTTEAARGIAAMARTSPTFACTAWLLGAAQSKRKRVSLADAFMAGVEWERRRKK